MRTVIWVGAIVLLAFGACKRVRNDSWVAVHGLYAPSGERDQTEFRMAMVGSDVCFRFDTVDRSPCVVENVETERDLERGDRVEFYLASRPDMRDWYYCVEIDPEGRVLDYRARFYRQMDYGWHCPTLRVTAVRRPAGYSIEARIDRRALADLGITSSDCWIGIFRADAVPSRMEPSWFSARPFPAGPPDFHVPCMLSDVHGLVPSSNP